MPSVSLSLVVLKTHQLETVRLFYETIGIDFAEEQQGSGPVHYLGTLGESVLEIYPLQEGEADSTTRLGFTVEDLGYVLESLRRRELLPLKKAKQTEWGLRAVVKDPDGRSIEFYHGGDDDGR
jgi:lactoylglutathione lyase